MKRMAAGSVAAFGQPPGLIALPRPVRGPGQALLEVELAPLNLLDVLVASGNFYGGSPPLPYVPGLEAVGRVLESDVHAAGAVVWWSGPPSRVPATVAKLAVAPDDELLPLPDGLSPTAAAAAGLTALTAWSALEHTAELKPGEQVVVLGASGGVGQAAVQAARILGARRVVAVGRDSESLRRSKAQGADEVVTLTDLDAADPANITNQLLAALDGPADVVIDPVWGPAATAALGALGVGGRLVNIGGSASPTASLPSALIRGRSLSVRGFLNLALSRERKHDVMRRVLLHAASGELLVDHEEIPLSELAAAWQNLTASPRQRLLIHP